MNDFKVVDSILTSDMYSIIRWAKKEKYRKIRIKILKGFRNIDKEMKRSGMKVRIGNKSRDINLDSKETSKKSQEKISKNPHLQGIPSLRESRTWRSNKFSTFFLLRSIYNYWLLGHYPSSRRKQGLCPSIGPNWVGLLPENGSRVASETLF